MTLAVALWFGAPLLERVISSFGQPATMAEKWAAELTKAWVTTVEDAARLLALEREEKRNGVRHEAL